MNIFSRMITNETSHFCVWATTCSSSIDIVSLVKHRFDWHERILLRHVVNHRRQAATIYLMNLRWLNYSNTNNH
jgi:hypothetical protein